MFSKEKRVRERYEQHRKKNQGAAEKERPDAGKAGGLSRSDVQIILRTTDAWSGWHIMDIQLFKV